MAVVAGAGEPGLGFPVHPGSARGDGNGRHPAGVDQALVGLPESVPLAPGALGPKHAVERASVGLLVAATLVQLFTGFANALNWYPFRWDFVPVHWALAWVVAGSVLLHIGVKLPDIVYGLQTRLADGDVLSEIPWNENPVSHSNAGQVAPPPTPALSRRGVLTATGLGLGAVVITTVGQTVKPLEPLGLLAIRQPHRGPQGVPVNRTADQAQVMQSARDPAGRCACAAATPYELSLVEIEAMELAQAWLPIACVEGWSALAHWSGLRLIDWSGAPAATRPRWCGSVHSSLRASTPPRSSARSCGRAAGDPSQRGTAETRSRLSAAVDRSQPGGRAEHQVAVGDRGAAVKAWRIVLASLGVSAVVFGTGRADHRRSGRRPAALVVWLAAAVIIHDALWSPGLLGVGALLSRVPARGRRYLQGGLVVGAALTVLAVPMIYLHGRQPPSKSILLQDVGANLALLLGIIAAVSGAAYVVRWSATGVGAGPDVPATQVPDGPGSEPARRADRSADVGVVGEEAVHPCVEERLDLTARSPIPPGSPPLRNCSGRKVFSRRKVQPITCRPAACASAMAVVGDSSRRPRREGSSRPC